MLQPLPKAALLLALPVLCILCISFTTHTFTGASTLTRYWQDTVPPTKQDRSQPAENRDIDEHLRQLDRAIEKLEQQLGQKDWNRMQADMQAALSRVDAEKIQQQINAAMQRIDAQKMQLEAQEALRKIDLDKLQQSLQQTLNEVKDTTNWHQMKAQIEQAMKEAQKSMAQARKINFDKLKADMQATRAEWDKQKGKLDNQLNTTREQMEQNRTHMKQQLESARANVEKAKAELQQYKVCIDEMDRNGLINSKENYTIEYRNKELYLNGVKQSQEITDRYAPYFKKDPVQIRKEKGNFSINGGQEK